MPALSVMMKPSSGNCNMHCDYCFYCDEMVKRTQQSYGFMSEQTLKNVIRKTMLQAEYAITYAYQGGEPTLRGLDFFKKSLEFQRQYNRNHLQVSNALQTNGYGLTEEWARFLKENHFLVGVSVDGTKEIHDGYRHKASDRSPTYDRICRNIDMLEKFGVDYNILTVITEKAAHHAREIYENYKRRGWHFHQFIECLDPLEEECNHTPYSLQAESYGIFLTELFDLWYADWKKGLQPYNRKFENYVAILLGRPPEACDQRGICGIQIVVEADGGAYPCDFYMVDKYRLGNFNEDRLPQMNQRREEIGFVERSRKVASQCRTCPYFYICRCGCQRSRYPVADEGTYINRFCKGYQYFFDHCLDRLQEIADLVRQQYK